MTAPIDGEAPLAPPPPPFPPPPPVGPSAPPRRRGLGGRAATAAVAGGLVVGGIAGGYVISQAASPSASPTPAAGAAAGAWHRGDGAARTQDLQQIASLLGVSGSQLQTEMQSGKTIAAIAAEHHVSISQLISAFVADESADIDAAVKSGELTVAQASQLKSILTQRVTDMMNGTLLPHGHPGGRFGPGGGEDLQVAASAIGITEAQLKTELEAGRTIAAVATEHKVAPATVISALIASEDREIEQRVAAGQMTAADAAQAKAMTQQRVTDMVNGTRPGGGPPGRGWNGAPWGPPPGGPAAVAPLG